MGGQSNLPHMEMNKKLNHLSTHQNQMKSHQMINNLHSKQIYNTNFPPPNGYHQGQPQHTNNRSMSSISADIQSLNPSITANTTSHPLRRTSQSQSIPSMTSISSLNIHSQSHINNKSEINGYSPSS